jgi:multidrug transporter EmrE-like cation transporter
MNVYYGFLAAAIVAGVIGQVLLKTGSDGSISVITQFLNPFTVIGFGMYALGGILYVVAIKKIPVSLAYPSVAVSYIAVALIAHFMWNEPFGLPQLGGIVMIGGGILLLHQ